MWILCHLKVTIDQKQIEHGQMKNGWLIRLLVWFCFIARVFTVRNSPQIFSSPNHLWLEAGVGKMPVSWKEHWVQSQDSQTAPESDHREWYREGIQETKCQSWVIVCVLGCWVTFIFLFSKLFFIPSHHLVSSKF